MANATLLVDCRCTLGEGLTWSVRQQAWLWTDIQERRIWRHRPSSGETTSWRVPDRVGAFVVARSGRLLLGLAKGLAWGTIDEASESIQCEPLVDVESAEPTTRINDGRTDRSGHFVFGTMSEAAGHPATGHLYQFSTKHGLRRLDAGTVGISNSICFSRDGRTIYFCDSMTRRIMCADYDAEAARLANIRTFVVLDAAHGMPDGSVIDADGALWNAQWGSAAVRCYSADGVLQRTSLVPSSHVTCPAFGGPDLSVLATTTAQFEMEPEALVAEPQAGGLFEIASHGVRGLADLEFND